MDKPWKKWDSYPNIWQVPQEWLDAAFKGEKNLMEPGVAVMVNGEFIQFVELMTSWIMDGKNWLILKSPGCRIEKGDDVKVVTRYGGFVLWKGKYGDDGLIVEDMPEETIAKKAERAKAALGISEDKDEF